ncbi:hypothetical protein BFF78_25540 [Streptomyces fodineus]|uniref:Glycosyltransferase 2-like domain-containing protein n=1 Tax=Streptomyces fodineus TaxID=1904616 RepID=A0A1D7YEJ9_9ACTN|nr:hypothetical protein BFF78_25540 [Streptomyces fodineus]
MPPHTARVGVVVIGYNDHTHVGDAVRSALAQGPAVAEVIAVDDCSTDGSADLLDRLAADEPRLRVVRRSVNSGGCGSPRNAGFDAVLAASTEANAEVASGLCVRRELPSGREQPWQEPLYTTHTVLARPSQHPRRQSRDDDRTRGRTTVPLTPSGADSWSAELAVHLAALGAGTWDLRLTVRFADGAQREVTAHALTGAGRLRRRAVPSVRHGVLLVQPYATHSGALAVRMATGGGGVARVAAGRLRRLLH